jgi:hypothetical protein
LPFFAERTKKFRIKTKGSATPNGSTAPFYGSFYSAIIAETKHLLQALQIFMRIKTTTIQENLAFFGGLPLAFCLPAQ